MLGGCVLSGSCAVSGCYAVFGVQIGSILSVLLDNLQMGLVVVLDVLLSVLLIVLLGVLLGVLLKEKYLKLLVTTQNSLIHYRSVTNWIRTGHLAMFYAISNFGQNGKRYL